VGVTGAVKFSSRHGLCASQKGARLSSEIREKLTTNTPPKPCVHLNRMTTTSCGLCLAFVHDTLETKVKETFPKQRLRIQPILRQLAQSFTRALLECMTDEKTYKNIVADIQSYVPLMGREKVQDTFLDSVGPLRRLVAILECDLFDCGVSKLVTIRSWLREISFDLFVLAQDIHLEHTQQKPYICPKGAPTALLPSEKDPLYF
jgi:hypothetical protein